MPEYRKTDAADWVPRRDWDSVREELRGLLEAGEDCGEFSVRIDNRGDEERADRHPKTRDLFFRVAQEALVAIERVNAGADYHLDNEQRRRWVSEWLAAGADPGARGPKGWTPLHFAAAGNWGPDLVAALVDAGAAVGEGDDGGGTPLHLAARYGSPEVAVALRTRGAGVDARDAAGRTPLHGAAWDGAPDSAAQMVAALVDAGADVDARTKNRLTPLHLAAWRGPLEAVTALREAGADVNARNKDDWTPLHLVARYDRPKVIAAALLAAGADPNLRTRDGWTALRLAAAQGGRGVVESLLAAGADAGARNEHGATALDLALAYRRPPDVIAPLRAAGVHGAGRSRDRSTGLVEPSIRKMVGAAVSSASRRWSGELPLVRAEPGGVDRAASPSAESRPRLTSARRALAAGVRRLRKRWRWLGALAVVAVVGVWAGTGDDGRSSPPIRDNAAPDAAAPRGAGADAGEPIPDGATVAPPEAEVALNLGASARRRIQAGLSAAGFEPGPADGVFGAGTRDAIRAWQTARGAPATGYLSREEADDLFELGAGDREYAGSERGGGRLTVRAAPESRIELDGADVGVTGATGLLMLSEVQPGRHVVVARKEGHTEATGVVEVFEGRAEVVELTLAALPGRLTVTANVADARLQIGDAGDRRLPLNGLELPPGSHRVTVSREGFRTVENEVEIRPGALTTLDLVLEPAPVEDLLRAALDMFVAGNYREAADGARSLLDLRPDAGAAHLLLGTALYELGEFDESIDPLGRAILLGEEVVLPAKHRHGGAGLRQGFCRGTVTLSRSEVAFLSGEQPDHGFSVTPDKVTNLEVTQSLRGSAFRLNTSVQDEERGIRRRNFDFVHRNAARAREDPESPVIVLTCPDCDGSLNVQAALMNYLTRLAR